MAGTNRPVCHGWIESDTFRESKHDLLLEVISQGGILDEIGIDYRLEALLWASEHGGDDSIERCGNRNLWVGITPFGDPPLRVYFRPIEPEGECELLWIETRP